MTVKLVIVGLVLFKLTVLEFWEVVEKLLTTSTSFLFFGVTVINSFPSGDLLTEIPNKYLVLSEFELKVTWLIVILAVPPLELTLN